jgi:phosphohistidine phosphatase
MRRLMLLRHAKAKRPEQVKDFDRPLKAVGRDQARLVGEYMAAHGFVPHFALVSTAIRASETFDLVDIFLHPPPQRADEPAIYEATPETLFKIVRRLPPRQSDALLVGHNPGFEELASELIGSGDEAMLTRFGRHMPTAALAVIDFDADRWNKIERKSGRLVLFITPALIEAEK